MRKRNDKKYDESIIAALNKLTIPLTTFDRHKVYFEENKRNNN